MRARKYRVAVAGGAGTWGRHYLHAYAEHPDCEVIALIDRARQRRQKFADHYGIEAVYDSVDELLAREIPDIVSAILPVEQAHDAVIACAEAGVKVVSCEKPIAAQLARADEMVRVCRERGTAFGCGTGYWDAAYLEETAAWIRAGNIGEIVAAALPGGLPQEISGGGCVQLTQLRLLTGKEVEWVEGWTLPPAPGWVPPPGVDESEGDRPAYGRLGMSGGIVCEVPEPRPEGGRCPVSIQGEEGQVWITGPRPVLIQGSGAAATPVFPDFLEAPRKSTFVYTIERLMHAFDAGGGARCSGHDYRQALEIAIALNESAQCDHQRIALPLEDRSMRIFPHPYRLQGGDVAGWESIGYTGPPQLD